MTGFSHASLYLFLFLKRSQKILFATYLRTTPPPPAKHAPVLVHQTRRPHDIEVHIIHHFPFHLCAFLCFFLVFFTHLRVEIFFLDSEDGYRLVRTANLAWDVDEAALHRSAIVCDGDRLVMLESKHGFGSAPKRTAGEGNRLDR